MSITEIQITDHEWQTLLFEVEQEHIQSTLFDSNNIIDESNQVIYQEAPPEINMFDTINNDTNIQSIPGHSDTWFSGSQAINPDGTPLTLYHGTSGEFTEFQKGDIGFHFGTIDQATNRNSDIIMEVNLSIKNPYHNVSDLGQWDDLEMLEEYFGSPNEGPLSEEFDNGKIKNVSDFITAMESHGYDGITYENRFEGEGQSWVAFRSDQIRIINVTKSIEPQDKILSNEALEFKSWFGDSKIVDENKDPLVLYHGTKGDFSVFKEHRDIGYHFGTIEQANNFATKPHTKEIRPEHVGGNIMPVYLSIKNPLRLEDLSWNTLENQLPNLLEKNIISDSEAWLLEKQGNIAMFGKTTNERKQEFKNLWNLYIKYFNRAGYDGIVYENKYEGKGDSYIAFSPTQIKSIYNRGTFDTNPNILFSGFDPTFGKWNHLTISEILQPLINKPKGALHHLINIGNQIWNEGYQKPKKWLGKMRSYLGDTWKHFKKELKTTYYEVTKCMKLANKLLAMGMCGTFGGINAKVADHCSLAMAKQLEAEGVSSELIRKQSGWHRSMDHKWRFEIDDRQMEFKFPFFDANKMAEIAIKQNGSATLENLIQHEELFNAYPAFRNIEVYTKNLNSDDGLKGGIDESGKIVLKDSLSPTEIKQTIIHEIQHLIQDKERFACGGKEEDFAPKDITEKEVQKIDHQIHKLLDENSEYAKLFRENNRLRIEEREGDLSQERERILDKLNEFEVDSKIFDLQLEIDHLRRNPRILSAHEQYSQLAGEIEARDAASRIAYNNLERNYILPDLPPNATVIFKRRLDAIQNVSPKPCYYHYKDPNPTREYQNQAKALLQSGHATNLVMDKTILINMMRNEYEPHELIKALAASPNFATKSKDVIKKFINEISKIPKVIESIKKTNSRQR